MRKIILSAGLFSISLVYLYVSCLDKEKQAGIQVKVFFSDKDSVSKNSIQIKAEVYNAFNKPIDLPELPNWGLKNDPFADFIIHAEKKEANGIFGHFDFLDSYNPQFSEIKLVKLDPQSKITDSINVAMFYSYRFPPGFYRIRVLFKLSRYNHLSDTYSNWAEFHIR